MSTQPTMSDPTPPAPAAEGDRGRVVAALWLSALLLAALVVVQAGRAARFWAPSTAHADVVSYVSDYTLLTFDGGSEDILAVLDGRGERLLTYRVRNQNAVEPLQSYDLPEVFEAARRIGPGGRR